MLKRPAIDASFMRAGTHGIRLSKPIHEVVMHFQSGDRHVTCVNEYIDIYHNADQKDTDGR